MKNLNFVTGFLAATCFFLLISANSKQNPTENMARYQLTIGGTGGYVYDAVTGYYKYTNKLGRSGNLEDLLKGTE